MSVMVLLAALGPAVPLPPQARGEVTARLTVTIPDQGAAPGLAQARWTLEVEGPPTLEIDGPRLEDALDGWRRPAEASSWAPGRVEVTWLTVQTKPGVVPLPGVTLRVRAGPAAAWDEVSWHDILQEPRDVPPPIAPPAAPASPWPRRLLFAAFVVQGAVLLLLGARRWRRWRARPVPPPTPREAALAALESPELPGPGEPRARFAHVAAVVRDFLERERGVPAGRLTTDELAAALRAGGLAEDDILRARNILVACDRVKFSARAGVPDCAAAARELIATLPGKDGAPAGPREVDLPGEDG